MIVVDCSALVDYLVDTGPRGQAIRARLKGEELAAPMLLDYELLHALVGVARGRSAPPDAVTKSLRIYRLLSVKTYPATPFETRIVQLAANLSAYDAAYIALAELLGVPLVTSDGKLHKGYTANGGTASVELF